MEEWIEAGIYTTSNAVICVTDMLTELGITGFAVEDAEDFQEFLDGTVANWDFVDESLMRLKDCETKVIFYIKSDDNGDEPGGEKMLSEIKERLFKLPEEYPDIQLGSLELELKEVKEEDWSNEWKKYYRPVRAGKRVVICPEWEEYNKKPSDIILKLNPGMAFGTGQHDTTRLCIKLLEANIHSGESVLDVGCGSGILAITALLLGANHAKGADIDEMAVKTAKENAALNSTEDKAEFYTGTLNSVPELNGKYDVICMNIVADVIIGLLNDVKEYMTAGAHIIISGVIDEREKDVERALKQNGFKIRKRLSGSCWRAFDCTAAD